MPTISVLLPVYNAERYVAEAVESILAQTFGDFELLITDDGSTDGSFAILTALAERDDRIKFVSRPNTGYLVALNQMIESAQGEFLARMDADDVAAPERFEKQVKYLREHPDCVAIGSRVLIADPDGDVLCEWNRLEDHFAIDEAHLRGDEGAVICHPSVMMRRAAVVAVGGYKAEFYTAEDFELFLRLAEVGRLANLPQPLLKYRMHPQSICHTRTEEQRDAARRAIAAARQRRKLEVGPVADPQRLVKGGEPIGAKWGWWALLNGHTRTARKHAWREVRRAPISRDAWRLFLCALRGH